MATDSTRLDMQGYVDIYDDETDELILATKNSIHYGNMANLIALALNNTQASHIQYMAFGNGATSVDTSGRVLYKMPRVSESLEASADLYNRTYAKTVTEIGSVTDKIEVIPGASFTDIKVTCTLAYEEPATQDLFDTSSTSEGEFVFDEIALFSFPSDTNLGITTSKMLTHVVFHPVQKSQNRRIRVVYTIRIQLS